MKQLMRRGFTFVELMIGLAITTVVVSALAAVTFAVSVGWRDSERSEIDVAVASQVQARLGKHLQTAGRLGAVRRGSLDTSATEAALFFWKGDLTGGSSGQIDFNEIGLLLHDRATGQLRLHEASDFASWPAAARDAANLLASSAYINAIANADDFVQACPSPRVLLGNVKGIVLATHTTGDRPAVEFVLQLEGASPGELRTHYGTITLRAPVSPGN